jgi:hypothetical protein
MVGSVSHLMAKGLDSYAGDLCGITSSVGARVGKAVEVVPFVPFRFPCVGWGGGSGSSSILMPGS